ncbi:hypothetical protein BH10PSE7_BH10PSE7_02150 [soil metagenome]
MAIYRIVSIDEPNGIDNATDGGNYIYVKEGVLVSRPPGGSPAIALNFGSNVVTVHGEVAAATGDGIDFGYYFGFIEGEETFRQSDNNKLAIGETGIITGQGFHAISILGSNNLISNQGQILENGNSSAIQLFAGNGLRIQNSGSIVSANGAIDLSGSIFSIPVTGNNFIDNTGTIQSLGTDFASRIAIKGSAALDTVNNAGLINGNIMLGGGDDVFDGDGGRVQGTVYLEDGADTYTGGDFRDAVSGGTGNDSVDLGGGKDSFIVGGTDGNDEADGGDGWDTYFAGYTSVAVEIDLLGSHASGSAIGNDVILDFEKVVGSSQADRLIGDDDSNGLQGRAGADVLIGNGGRDWLSGGNDADTIYGNTGRDVLTGGTGADQFVYNSISEAGIYSTRDVITDFAHASDKINLSPIDANTGVGGDQAFAFIGTAAFTVAGQLRYQTAGAATIVSGDINGDHIADFEIQLSGAIAVTGVDFIL